METLKNKERVQSINDFMYELLDKNNPLPKRDIYQKYEDILSTIEPLDLFYLSMYSNHSDYSIEEIKETAGKFVNVFYHGLSTHQPDQYDSVLFQYFIKENRAIEEHLNQIKPFFKKNVLGNHIKEITSHLERCLEIERKFIKKENILFPALEKKLPSTKPLEVLWSLHDDARYTLKVLLQELKKDQLDISQIIYLIGEYYNIVFGINTKEELILLPVADTLLSIEDKQKLFEESKEYGYVFIDNLPEIDVIEVPITMIDGVFHSQTGELQPLQLHHLMSALPVDITFVDHHDRVMYFNDRKERHFPRNPSIIGRLVKHCHPPKSVHVVEEILEAFKSNTQNKAEFWIEFNHAFLYITYYAMRDKNGSYIGTLEVSQDVTRIRNLTGQKRLLDWS